jgi:ribosome-associated protein
MASKKKTTSTRKTAATVSRAPKKATVRAKKVVAKRLVKKPAAAARSKPGVVKKGKGLTKKKLGAKPLAKRSIASSAKKSAPKKRVLRTAKRPLVKAKKAVRAKKTPAVVVANPEALKLSRRIAELALDKKALQVTILDVTAKSEAVGYDYLVIASGESDAQLSAMADSIEDALRTAGRKATSMERSPEWVLVNFDDVVVHLFTPDARGHYDLEGLWSDSPRLSLT